MTSAAAVVFVGVVILAVFGLLALAERLVGPRPCALCDGTGVDPFGAECSCRGRSS